METLIFDVMLNGRFIKTMEDEQPERHRRRSNQTLKHYNHENKKIHKKSL